MRTNTIKERLLAGKPVLGAGLVWGSALIGETVAYAGCDYAIIDQQHGAWDDVATVAGIRSLLLGGATPVVRVPKNDYALIGRVLDQGALGVIVPMVNSVEDAEAAVQATKYPPLGGRSWGPFGAGMHGGDYGDAANDEVLLLVQIETRQAAVRAKNILSVEGVDGCWIGPSDMARSLGVDYHAAGGAPETEAAIASVLAACLEAGKIPGIWAGGVARKRLEQGFKFVTITNDEMLIVHGVKEILGDLESYRG